MWANTGTTMKNSAGFSLPLIPLYPVLILAASPPLLSGQAVLTRSYDNLRSGGNTQEKNLTSASIEHLKKLRELALDAGDDPRLEAQPLYVPQLQMADGPHDVVIVSTMANNVYTFDVNSGAKLWKQNIGTPVSPKIIGKTAFGLDQTEIDSWGINVRWGILSTPVIDIDTDTLYIVNWSSPDGKRNNAVHKLNALNLKTGQPSHPALTIQASAGPNVRFNSPKQKQRSALLL